MNVRKPTDYSVMYAALDELMRTELPQMKLYSEIGRLVSARAEKGAAVAEFPLPGPDSGGGQRVCERRHPERLCGDVPLQHSGRDRRSSGADGG